MRRRTLIASASAALAAPALRPAAAQAPTRAETLLLVQEYGPNTLDMQGIGSSQPVNGVALNCYDRLLRFKPVPIPGGAAAHLRHDRARARARRELAGRLRRHELHLQAARRQVPFRPAGHGQGREVVARPRRLDRRLRDDADERGLAGEARAVRRARRQDLPHRLRPQGQADDAEPRRHHPLRLRQRARDQERRRRPLGQGLAEEQRRGLGRLQGRELEAGHRDDLRPQRRLDVAARCRSCAASSRATSPRPRRAAR